MNCGKEYKIQREEAKGFARNVSVKGFMSHKSFFALFFLKMPCVFL